MKHRFVNGRYLGRAVTGVERFANMILQQIDAGLSHENEHRERWTLLLPKGVETPEWWHQPVETIGTLNGHPWEQTSLAWQAWRQGPDAVLINLCNSGPIWGGKSLTVIHDAMPYDVPENFRASYRILHRTMGRLLARHSSIATVSAFSQERLAVRLGIPQKTIAIISNAAEHVATLAPDMRIIERLGLTDKPFLLTVGSFAPNKNLMTAIRAFSVIAEDAGKLVLVGAAGKSFADHGFGAVPAGVVTPGRISDEELVALYRHARALVFPSRYEGFGIPPLEALQLGCPVIASDIAPTREVCGDLAAYFPPDDVDRLTQLMKKALTDPAYRAGTADAAMHRTSLFSWSRSAQALRSCVDALD